MSTPFSACGWFHYSVIHFTQSLIHLFPSHGVEHPAKAGLHILLLKSAQMSYYCSLKGAEIMNGLVFPSVRARRWNLWRKLLSLPRYVALEIQYYISTFSALSAESQSSSKIYRPPFFYSLDHSLIIIILQPPLHFSCRGLWSDVWPVVSFNSRR